MLSLGKSLPNLTPFLKIPSRRSPNRPSPQKTDELTWFDLLHKNFLYFLCGSTKVNELYIVIYTYQPGTLKEEKGEMNKCRDECAYSFIPKNSKVVAVGLVD